MPSCTVLVPSLNKIGPCMSEKWLGTHLFLFFMYTVEARMRAKHRMYNKGSRRRGAGEGRKKAVGNRDTRRSVEGRGMWQGTQGKQDGHCRDFQEGKQGI